MQKIAYKQIGTTLMVRLTDQLIQTVLGPVVPILLSLVQQYNKFFRQKDYDAIRETLRVYEARPVSEAVVHARWERKKIRNQIVAEVQTAKPATDSWFINREGLQVLGDKVTLTGFTFGLPESFLAYYKSWTEAGESVQPLLNFMYNLVVNPSTHVRDRIFDFLVHTPFLLTPDGYLVTFRRVVLKEKGVDSELHEFAQKAYALIRLKKKATEDYYIFRDEAGALQYAKRGAFVVHEAGELGSVKALRNSIPNPTIYTDAHTRTFSIQVGELVSMPREDCEDNPEQCHSGGLHQATLSYVRGGYYGSQLLMCLVNPADIVAVPYSESQKFRCSAYLPIAELTDEDLDTIEQGSFRVFDDEQVRPKASREQLKTIGKVVFKGYVSKVPQLKEKLHQLRPRQKPDHLTPAQQSYLQNRVVQL